MTQNKELPEKEFKSSNEELCSIKELLGDTAEEWKF
jgi:hypothetical protein